MTGLAPLLLLWAFTKYGGGAPAQPKISPQPSVPAWPTAASPPPPMPAFQPQPPPPPVPAPTADTGTPLAALHAASKQPEPAAPQPKPPPKKPATPAAKAKAAIAKKLPTPASALKKGLSLSTSSKAPAQQSASVAELQKILNVRGAKLKADGLYGPKTASAWQSIAKQKGLPPAISRVGPKVAKVVTQTYEALKVPPAP